MKMLRSSGEQGCLDKETDVFSKAKEELSNLNKDNACELSVKANVKETEENADCDFDGDDVQETHTLFGKNELTPSAEVDQTSETTSSLAKETVKDCFQHEFVEVVDDVEETIFLENTPSGVIADKTSETTPSIAKEIVQDCFEHESATEQGSCFDNLPEELLLEVFSYLPLKQLYTKMTLVCKQWRIFSLNPLLWQKLPYKEIKLLTTDCLIELVGDRCSLLKDLSLKCRSDMHNYEFLTVAKLCPMLQKLSLSFCTQATSLTVSYFVDNCPHLQDIYLEGCEIRHDCMAVLSALPHLIRLNVSHCTHLDDASLIDITTKFRHLRSINFDGIQWITDSAVKVMVENCWDHLEYLWLDGANLTDDGIRLISRCQKLRVFSLSFCDELRDDSLTWIQQMKRLHTLRIKKGLEFGVDALADLFIHLHHDQMMNPAGLCHLTLAECLALDDDAVFAIVTSCPNLITLDLSWCWDITDEGLEHIIQNCPRIRDLNICGLREVTGDPLKDVPVKMPRLTILDARQCNTMKDELLSELVTKIPKLTVIDYYGDYVTPNDHNIQNKKHL